MKFELRFAYALTSISLVPTIPQNLSSFLKNDKVFHVISSVAKLRKNMRNFLT